MALRVFSGTVVLLMSRAIKSRKRLIFPYYLHCHGATVGVVHRCTEVHRAGACEFKSWCENDAEEYYQWSSEDILTPQQLRYAQEHLDERDYNEQYRASWETVGGLVFYAFSEGLDVRQDACYDKIAPLIIGSDFNVDRMCWIIAQVGGARENHQLRVFDELFIRDTNTPKTLDILFNKYGDHKAGFIFMGDAAARVRNTSAHLSDYLLIKSDERFGNKRVQYSASNPKIADRFAATNALFCNAVRQRRCVIHPRCVHLIEDLNARAYVPGTSDPADSNDVGHMTDALGYIVWQLFPIKLQTVSTGEISIAYSR